ncbi:MAG TPA: CaiB/BaiF CoA-transferase family protein [Beijerinckiaceae bacterium]|nr:CaiB/BaiF CoA-transferase family protein [Beijerinckiaceae bacterium]
MSAPLSGIRVLELARILAGPWAGQLLADLGADVVKVERSKSGDDTRAWGPPFVEGADGSNLGAGYYHSCNRGKRDVVADFETPEGQKIVRQLARHADVLIENFKLGGLKKYGLDYDSLKQINPKLIYCSITGFGQNGPYAARPGYDFLVQGMGGLMSITGPIEGPPYKAGIAVADVFTGLYSTIAIQAALFRRERTGEGAFIDCCLIDSLIGIMGNQALFYLISGKEPPRMGNAHATVIPYDVFKAADGNFIIASGNDAQFQRLMRLLGRPELAEDARFLENKDRIANRVELTRILNGLTSKFSRADLIAKCEAAGVPAGPINTLSEVFADPQVIARQMRIDRPNKRAKGGTTPGLRTPITIDGVHAAAPLPAPALGEHTRDVLSDPAWGGGVTQTTAR